MNPQAKLWISLFVVAFDIGLVLYLASSSGADPIILIAIAAMMVLSSIHVVMIIWFGDKWYSSPEFRDALRRLMARQD